MQWHHVAILRALCLIQELHSTAALTRDQAEALVRLLAEAAKDC